MRSRLETLYEAIGGMEGCRRLSGLFHARVARHPLLSTLFPANLDRLNEHLVLFLAEQTGGPAGYTRARGKQSLVCRHAHLPIGGREGEAWLAEMAAAMEEAGLPEDAREVLREYFVETAAVLADPLLPLYHVPLQELRRQLERDRGLATFADHGRTLLREAAGRWDVERVQLLLEHGSSPHIKDALGHDALYRAANAHDSAREADGRATVELLIRYGANVNSAGGPGDITPLHAAARRGSVQVATALLDAGAAIEARDSKGESPLRRAVNCKQRRLVTLLLSRGVDPLSPDKHGKTPLDVAGPLRELLCEAAGG